MDDRLGDGRKLAVFVDRMTLHQDPAAPERGRSCHVTSIERAIASCPSETTIVATMIEARRTLIGDPGRADARARGRARRLTSSFGAQCTAWGYRTPAPRGQPPSVSHRSSSAADCSVGAGPDDSITCSCRPHSEHVHSPTPPLGRMSCASTIASIVVGSPQWTVVCPHLRQNRAWRGASSGIVCVPISNSVTRASIVPDGSTRENPRRTSAEGSQGSMTDVSRSGQGLPKAVAGGASGPVGATSSLPGIVSLLTSVEGLRDRGPPGSRGGGSPSSRWSTTAARNPAQRPTPPGSAAGRGRRP
jgi:hypothetical protein